MEIKQKFHPGSYIKDSLEALAMSSREFSLRTGISERTLSDLLNEKGSVTFDIATKLAAFFGSSVEMWLNLQTQYNIYMFQLEYNKEVEQDYQKIKALRPYLKDIVSLSDNESHNSLVNKVRATICVNNITSLSDVNSFASLKELKNFEKKNMFEKNFWIALALSFARKNKDIQEYDRKKLLSYIPELRSMTNADPDSFLPRIKEILSSCGVSFVVLPYLPKSNIYGATKWLNSNKVMLAMSNRGGKADLFWFTFFHELGHVTFEHKRYMLLNTEGQIDIEADKFATDTLISPDSWSAFLNANKFDLKAIKDFAAKECILPCIVLGRLHKEGIVPYGTYDKELSLSYNISYKVE